jgi:DNA-binding NarL/FixJ family response regulator
LHHPLKEFRLIQQRRDVKSGRKRAQKAAEQYKEIQEAVAKNPGMSNRAIAVLLGTSERTVRQAKLHREPVEDGNGLEEDQPDVV